MSPEKKLSEVPAFQPEESTGQRTTQIAQLVEEVREAFPPQYEVGTTQQRERTLRRTLAYVRHDFLLERVEQLQGVSGWRRELQARREWRLAQQFYRDLQAVDVSYGYETQSQGKQAVRLLADHLEQFFSKYDELLNQITSLEFTPSLAEYSRAEFGSPDAFRGALSEDLARQKLTLERELEAVRDHLLGVLLFTAQKIQEQQEVQHKIRNPDWTGNFFQDLPSELRSLFIGRNQYEFDQRIEATLVTVALAVIAAGFLTLFPPKELPKVAVRPRLRPEIVVSAAGNSADATLLEMQQETGYGRYLFSKEVFGQVFQDVSVQVVRGDSIATEEHTIRIGDTASTSFYQIRVDEGLDTSGDIVFLAVMTGAEQPVLYDQYTGYSKPFYPVDRSQLGAYQSEGITAKVLEDLDVPETAQLAFFNAGSFQRNFPQLMFTGKAGFNLLPGIILQKTASEGQPPIDERVEAFIKDTLNYTELDAAEKGTLESKLAQYPEYAGVYEQLDEQLASGELSEHAYFAIRHVLARELWRYFRKLDLHVGMGELELAVNIPSEFISRLKNYINAERAAFGQELGTQNSDLSVGMTDLKAERITKEIYDQLPERVQRVLEFDLTLGHVTAESLSTYVSVSPRTGVTPVLSVERAVSIYSAMARVYEPRVRAVAEQYGLQPEQSDYLFAMMLASSTPPNDFGFLLLNEPERFENHWNSEVPATIQEFARQERQSTQ